MLEGVHAQLDVVARAGLQGVVADAQVFAPHEQHGLRHDFVQLHGVVAGAAVHAVQRHAQRQCLHSALPPALPGGVAGCGGCAHRFFHGEVQPPVLADLPQFGHHVVVQGVALRVVRCAKVQREQAAPGHHVDGTVGHPQHADGAHRIAVTAGALLQVDGEFRRGRRRIAPAVHGRRAGMAGDAHDLALEAQATVDGRDDAQGQAELVEDRALLDVHLHETQVPRRVALQRADGGQVRGQARREHGIAHGDAIGVPLLQPLRVEVSGQGARTQEGGPVALAFFFGEGDHLDPERQPSLRLRQRAHAGHRREDSQPPVVLAAVAHGVVVRSGQEVLWLCSLPPRGRVGVGALRAFARVVARHHIPHRIDLHLVEPALAHVACDLPGRCAMRLGEIGDGQLSVLGIAWIAVLRQAFLPVPDQVAQRRLRAELVVQPQLHDAVDVAQRLGSLELRVIVQPAGKGLDDLLAIQAGAARPAHGQDEGEAELRVVVCIELLDALELLQRAIGEAGLALFAGRLAGESLRHHGLAGELGVRPDQGQLLVRAGRAHDVRQRLLQMRERSEGPLRQSLPRDPRRVFVQPVEQAGGLRRIGGVDLFQGQRHVMLPNKGGPAASGERCRCGVPPTRDRAVRCDPGSAAAR